MFPIEIQIKRAGLTKRAHGQLMKQINRRCMERHRDERLDKRFTMAAYSELGARRRSTKYNQQKMRQFHHTLPNVATGTLHKSIRTTITATQHGSRLIIKSKLPDRMTPEEWAKLSPKQQAKENRKRRRLAKWQKEEIAKMSRREIREERKQQAREYKAGAKSPEFRRIRTRRIK